MSQRPIPRKGRWLFYSIPAQDVKLSTLAPEPSEPLEIMKPASETLIRNKFHPACLQHIIRINFS